MAIRVSIDIDYGDKEIQKIETPDVGFWDSQDIFYCIQAIELLDKVYGEIRAALIAEKTILEGHKEPAGERDG